MARPRSKDQLLAWIDRDWRRYTDRLAEVDPALCEVAGSFGWSIRDVVANIAAWERGTSALLRRQSRYAAMGIDGAAAATASIDKINESITAQARRQTLAQVRAEAMAAHEELRTLLDRVSWDDLNQPIAQFHPAMSASGGTKVLAYVAGDTYEHYVEHLADIDAIGAAVTAAREDQSR